MSSYTAFGDYKTVEKFNADTNTDTIIINNNVLIAKHHPKNFGKTTILYTTNDSFFETYSKIKYSIKTRDQGGGDKGGSYVSLDLYINDIKYYISPKKLICAPIDLPGRGTTHTATILLSKLLKNNKIDKSKLTSGTKYSIKLWSHAMYPQHEAIVDNITLTLTKCKCD